MNASIARLYTYKTPDQTTSKEFAAFVSMRYVCVAPSNANTLKCTAISECQEKKLTEYDIVLINTDLKALNSLLHNVSQNHVLEFHKEEEELLLCAQAVPKSFNCALVIDTGKIINNKHGVIVTQLKAPKEHGLCEYEITHHGSLYWIDHTTK